MVTVDHAGGKTALSIFTPEQAFRGATLMSVTIRTGRTHQIRAHLAGEGWPILGDPRYGTRSSRQTSQQLGVLRLALHADELALELGGRTQRWRAPLPAELLDALERAARRADG